jgi:hypothetical protein
LAWFVRVGGTVMGEPRDQEAARGERDRVVDALKTAFAQGRLTKNEFEVRVDQALAIYAHLDALTADIPAAPPKPSLPEGDASREPARQLHNKRAIQRGTAAGTAASMTLTAALAIPKIGVYGVILTVIVGVVMTVTLAGIQTLLWWALERNSGAQRSSAGPPDAGERALGYLTSADTDSRGQIIDEPGHTTEASLRRRSSATSRPRGPFVLDSAPNSAAC